VKYNNILNAMNSSASGITTYSGLYPNRLTIMGHTCGGGGLPIISSKRTALEKLCSRSARVKIMSPSVKFDLIFL
jgi:hypothetical protein